ncbi:MULTISPECIES: 50S ribosomal protein L4 [unclassified Gemella]|uniref:50S ribosomal protein L4 n=1 Tax=unclassified Gemella TaxID=2624949 RepID=UPI001C04BE52|nr:MULTISPECIES: 50S ribosomal protein L4 [unclassified Gemella]MBU0278388.1 50S ribosomal protein L4 [Gemella sp. zg-1178]QWQ38993.1 50S ribosomal protein L4 [Gemella sp. zg-570]
MTQLDLFKQDGTRVGVVEANDAVFGIEPNQHVLFQAVTLQRASLRQGTHKTKGRSEVSGGGRKPWRQKGTGRARQGSIRSPQWRGGGIVFGPTPRDYGFKMPRKMRRLALRSALSSKVAANEVFALETLSFDAIKTKNFKEMMTNLGLDKKVLFVVSQYEENALLSGRNIPGVNIIESEGLNVVDILGHNKVVFTKDAVEKVGEVLA